MAEAASAPARGADGGAIRPGEGERAGQPARAASPRPAQLVPVLLRVDRGAGAGASQRQGGVRARHVPARGPLRAVPAPAREESVASLLLRVSVSEEALLCYDRRGGEAAVGELVLRAPLLLATAAPQADAGDEVCVTPAAQETLKIVESMRVAPGEAHSEFQGPALLPDGPGPFVLGCDSARGARLLLDQLAAAGCVLQGLLSRHRLRKRSGSTGSGPTFFAFDTWSGTEVAVKLFVDQEPGRRIHPLREAMLLRWASNPLFPQFRAVYRVLSGELEELGLDEDAVGTDTFALVTEYLPGSEPFSFMSREGPLSEDSTRAVMRQVFIGLDALHQRGIILRSIKPDSVLLAGCGDQVKLVDFGSACVWWDTEAVQEVAGGFGYMAPELLHQPSSPQSSKVDCFGAGALMFACLAGHGPFHSATLDEVIEMNLHNRIGGQSMANFPRLAQDLLVSLLRGEPEHRPTMRQCLGHPWLEQPSDTPEPADRHRTLLDRLGGSSSPAAWHSSPRPSPPPSDPEEEPVAGAGLPGRSPGCLSASSSASLFSSPA